MWIEAGIDERATRPNLKVLDVLKRVARAWGRAWMQFAVAVDEVRPPLAGRKPWTSGQ